MPNIAKAFRDSSGELPAVHRALLDTPAAWDGTAAKFKTPHELVISTFRMLDFVPAEPRQIAAPFDLDSVADAFRTMEAGTAGKVLVRPTPLPRPREAGV